MNEDGCMYICISPLTSRPQGPLPLPSLQMLTICIYSDDVKTFAILLYEDLIFYETWQHLSALALYAQIRLKGIAHLHPDEPHHRLCNRLTNTKKKKNNLMAMCWRNVFVTNDGNVGTIERFEEVEKWNFTSWCRGRSSSCIRPLHPFYLYQLLSGVLLLNLTLKRNLAKGTTVSRVELCFKPK